MLSGISEAADIGCSFDRTCERLGTKMYTGPVDEQCELDYTYHEFDADLGVCLWN